MGYRGNSNKPRETCRQRVSDKLSGVFVDSSDANLDREIGTMHLSAKAKDDALKKLRLEIERLQEEKEDLVNGAGSVRYPQ
jgi:predicted  nucleic acid-binding Zn-ribbon protein